MKWLALGAFVVLSIGCTTTNTVNVIVNDDSIIKYRDKPENQDRFSNLYPGEKKYSQTCTENCYLPNKLIKCDTPAENCTFMGQQSLPELGTGFSVRWIGHASFYVNTQDGTSFLFDPVSKQFDWPVDLAFKLNGGFYRNEPKWLTGRQVKNVDAVLYSHIHYDHFNKSDIDKLGNEIEYFTPLKFASHFPNDGYKINEMAWFASSRLGNTDIHFVPANHFSNRILVPFIYEDNSKTLWGGWILESNHKKLFFAGDTGYSSHFKDIYKKYGDIDVCLLPIASYFSEQNPKWYRYVHMTPEDALTAAQDLHCKVIIPWGFGNNSWKMGDRSTHSPLLRFLKMHKQMKISIPIFILNEGEEQTF
ncbi:MBL fold metallo-hydrolase [Parashewanella spongiae]|uniref:MBL fold metallo-hydrolase n=1 Tax=Parashewanella spongiae TaxID=342950 RepID=A0A3A6TZW6_9GAMM|nr:MBL fold metallo-hydrolase [Parashewanella spongiae]MCL1077214.1 MBL fold metallo-hydrolase [Parashewanella spongiae]RJY18707.1 MBL fold metallo-hydrolase [Parashewanella spongiae]